MPDGVETSLQHLGRFRYPVGSKSTVEFRRPILAAQRDLQGPAKSLAPLANPDPRAQRDRRSDP